jgi:ABC-type Fe3+-hydroxamate transport system substrate-binding protein
MNPETQQSESPYCVKIETETGQSVTVPIAVLTPSQLEILLQSEFKKLAQEAGVKGVRIHVERAIAADYEQVLREVRACLSNAKAQAA